ncbi:tryptophan--tRNA ligase [archaeon]|jgi:tryptophanyl-tRNA synthetase|nr:tryptophan--tRNA ligase [archaeon]MBT4374017.1 tryptophan--tRNA ligase [archaeon]MBT4532113.1 tryptophan--tRNA ligase [archaeon]MBT7002003.1 tryptophan--tRNA ligase [archaeon]MBT7282714.1 tryptophan--tRNA ligase [archaeon]
MVSKLLEDNEKLVIEFGAKRIQEIKKLPNFYTFNKNLIYSHRDFDVFLNALQKGEKCAIVSGVNASGTLHLGHKVVFDTNLFFQKEYNLPVFIPISDDESFVAGKVKTQEEAKKNAMRLAKEMLAYGFDPNKTFFIIDNIYTNIYNFAFKTSTKINYSEIKSTYGYSPDQNIGLHFYPAVQAAHILLPFEKLGIKNILVPIGPDEDAHFRIARDIAGKLGIQKPSTIHLKFIPGLDGQKASKSKNNAIFLNDSPEILKKKCGKALSGGKETIKEHRQHGGNPEKDISCQYLSNFIYDKNQTEKLFDKYRKGELLSGEVKEIFFKEFNKILQNFQEGVKNINLKDLEKMILRNE